MYHSITVTDLRKDITETEVRVSDYTGSQHNLDKPSITKKHTGIK